MESSFCSDVVVKICKDWYCLRQNIGLNQDSFFFLPIKLLFVFYVL